MLGIKNKNYPLSGQQVITDHVCDSTASDSWIPSGSLYPDVLVVSGRPQLICSPIQDVLCVSEIPRYSFEKWLDGGMVMFSRRGAVSLHSAAPGVGDSETSIPNCSDTFPLHRVFGPVLGANFRVDGREASPQRA